MTFVQLVAYADLIVARLGALILSVGLGVIAGWIVYDINGRKDRGPFGLSPFLMGFLPAVGLLLVCFFGRNA